MTNVLFISSTNNIHDKRLTKLLEKNYNLTAILEFDDKNTSIEKIDKQEYDIVLYTPLSNAVPWEKINFKKAYGLCMAYEINDLGENSHSFEIIKKNIMQSSKVNFDNRFIMGLATEKFDIACTKTEIKYGCEIKYFLPKTNPNLIKPTVICNRSWSSTHRNEDVLAALEMLCGEGIDFESKFLEIPRDQKRILRLYPKLVNSGKLAFMPTLSTSEMGKELANADIFISASQSDGTSISLLEAMTNGKIVITTDFPANREVISFGNNGFTFKNQQAEDLYLVIKQILSLSQNEVIKISQRAHEYAVLNGDWTKESDKLIFEVNELIESVLT